MPALADRIEFAPPPPPGMLRALGLAILAHLLLVAALTWGVNWKRTDTTITAEAELWAAVPQTAAPKLVEPPPIPESKPEPKPEPKSEPIEPPKPTPPAPPDIVEKKTKPPPKVEPKPDPAPTKPLAKPEPKPKPETEPVKPKVDTAAQKKKLEAEDAKRQEDQRQENMNRMAGLAGATGGEKSTGTAQQSSGPSPGYAGRIAARIKPNIVFAGNLPDNPRVEVEIKAAPDGTILGRPRVTKSSGNREWDEAVVRAIEKTEVLPRDTDGRVPNTIPLSARPNDFN